MGSFTSNDTVSKKIPDQAPKRNIAERAITLFTENDKE